MLAWIMNLDFAAGAAAVPAAAAATGRITSIAEIWRPTIIACLVGAVLLLVP